MEADLQFAHRLADAADAITLKRFGARDLEVDTKPDLTPVSDADRLAEQAIRRLVGEARPREGVYGEEFGDDGNAVRWVVDPIDGTKNYIRGVPVWGTLLALERDGVVDVGVISAPALGHRWWALRGQGAWIDGRRCRVSSVGQIAEATVSTTSHLEMPPGYRTLAARARVSRGFGDFWQYCLLAEGAVDLASDAVLQLWDYAAVELIVAEAGGRSSTFLGAPPAPGGSFLSTNGAVHDEALALLNGPPPGDSS